LSASFGLAKLPDCLVSQDPDRVVDILEAACRVVARDGWHGLRMEAVAREAGVSKALVHYYFSTRRKLLRAAFAHSENRANERIEAELLLIESPLERVERFILSDLDDDPVYAESRALWREVWSGMRQDPELEPDVEGRYRTWVTRLGELVEDAAGLTPFEGANGEVSAWRLAALLDGVESLLSIGLMSPGKAEALLRESIAGELTGQAPQTSQAR
jgi:AcrR family transcriptional regulator